MTSSSADAPDAPGSAPLAATHAQPVLTSQAFRASQGQGQGLSRPALPTETVATHQSLLLPVPPRFRLDLCVAESPLQRLAPTVFDLAQPALQVVLYPQATALARADKARLQAPAIEVLVTQPVPGEALVVYGLPHRSGRGSDGSDAATEKLDLALTQELLQQLSSLLRLDEDLGVFYRLCDKDPELTWVPEHDAGRVLRSATVFEDLVKTILLTNMSLVRAQNACTQLCNQLGTRTVLGRRGFPMPEELLQADVAALAGPLGLGRWAATVRRLAQVSYDGQPSPGALRAPPAAMTQALDGPDEGWHDAVNQEMEWQDRLHTLLYGLPGMSVRVIERLLPLLSCYDGVRLDGQARAAWVKKFPPRRLPKPATRSEQHTYGLAIAEQIVKRLEPFGFYRGLAQLMLLRTPPSSV